MEYPALLTSTSILPASFTASCTTSPAVGEVTSRGNHLPPRELIWVYEGAEDGFRAVAMTAWPALRAWMASEAPRPVEQPVMSQTWGGVDAILSEDFYILSYSYYKRSLQVEYIGCWGAGGGIDREIKTSLGSQDRRLLILLSTGVYMDFR